MARKFLYLIAGIIIVVIAAMLALRIWSDRLTEMAFVPSVEFSAPRSLAQKAYADPAMWISRPGLRRADPARWVPEGYADKAESLDAAVFFVHPTSYFDKSHWNAPPDDASARALSDLFVRGMASPFNRSTEIWAPRYRQATIGAFLTSKPEGADALDLAYDDVLQAFDLFVANVPADRPIVLAGHSQGAFHLRRLIRERIAGTPLEKRIAAAYLIGWPISLEHDIPVMGLPACEKPDQAGCIVSWLSVAEPAETQMMLTAYGRRLGLDGKQVKESAFLCSNPLTGTPGGDAPASANLGTLVPDVAARSGTLLPGKVQARCRKDGFLSIGSPPDLALGPYVLPGNNYHLFDVTLFWANLRRDVDQRVRAWRPAR